MQNILFDLDGTLLPMDEEQFTKEYFKLLYQTLAKNNFPLAEDVFNNTFFKSTYAMYKNDGTQTNEQSFWQAFSQLTNLNKNDYENPFLSFYQNEFNLLQKYTKPNPIVKQIIDICKAKNFNLYLATNPIFPQVATHNRIKWAGLNSQDFLEISTFENYHYTKPNPLYFKEFLTNCNLNPQDCLMIGNNVHEDLVINTYGTPTYLVTNCLQNPKDEPISPTYQGTLDDLLQFLTNL